MLVRQVGHVTIDIYFDIFMHNSVQKSFTSTAYPGTHTGFFGKYFIKFEENFRKNFIKF